MAQSVQIANDSKQQFAHTNFVETPFIPNFEQVLKTLFTSIWNGTTVLENCRISLL